MSEVIKRSFGNGELTADCLGSGEDLLIIHSLLADRTAFAPVLPWLAARYRVTLVNLPGFHGSKPIAHGIENYADHLVNVFETGGLAANTTIIANGFGGTIALAMAIRHGRKFGKMVLCDVAAGFPPAGRKAFEVMADKVTHEGIASVATISAMRVFHEAYLKDHPDAVGHLRDILLGIAPEAFVAACHTLMNTDLINQLGAVDNPAMIVYGELDAATLPALCRQVADNIPGSQMIELKGCGHCPPFEQPDAFIAGIQAFLAA